MFFKHLQHLDSVDILIFVAQETIRVILNWRYCVDDYWKVMHKYSTAKEGEH